MRGTFIRLGAAAAFFCVVGCGTGEGAHPPLLVCPLCTPDPAASGVLVDFGVVAVGDEATRFVTLENTGDEPLRLEGYGQDLAPFSTSLACEQGCDPQVLAAGGSLQVGFTFRPVAVGAAAQELTLTSDAGSLPIHLSGAGAHQEVDCGPALGFGQLVQGTSATLPVTCTNVGGIAVALAADFLQDHTASFSLPPDWPAKTTPLEPGESLEIPVTFQAELLEEGVMALAVEGSLEVKDGAGSAVATLPLHAGVISTAMAITVDCPRDPYDGIDFGFVIPGTIRTCTVHLTNRANTFLTITTLAIDGSSDPEFGVKGARAPFRIPPASLGAGNTFDFQLTFGPPAADVGQRKGQLNLNSDDAAGAVRFWDLIGTSGGPVIACDPQGLTFGETTVGDSPTQSILCTNVTQWDDPTNDWDNLRVMNPIVKSDGTPFQASIAGGPSKKGYGPGESFRIDVTFSPLAAGPWDDDVVVATNDPEHPAVDLLVHGLGVAGP